MRLRTTFLWSMIASLSLSAVLGVVAILWERLGRAGEHALVTALLVGAFSMICLACAFVIDRRRVRPLMWLGVMTALAALAIWLFMIWSDFWRWSNDLEVVLAKTGATFTTCCLWAAHIGLLAMLAIHRESWRAVRFATLSVSTVLAVMIVFVFWFEVFEEWTGKMIAVLSILGSCGTVVTPILALIDKLKHRGEPVGLHQRVQITVVCPRCNASQVIQAGNARCGECGLRIRVDIEEPRCACGYLLYMLESTECPECGRAVPDQDRWIRTPPTSEPQAPSPVGSPTA